MQWCMMHTWVRAPAEKVQRQSARWTTGDQITNSQKTTEIDFCVTRNFTVGVWAISDALL